MLLRINQRDELGRVEGIAGNIPQLLRGERIYLLTELFQRLRLTQMKQATSHADSHILTILPRQSRLTLQLTFGSSKLTVGQRCIQQTGEFARNQPAAFVNIVMVTSEISGPDARIGVSCQTALDGIDQAAPREFIPGPPRMLFSRYKPL